MGFFQDLKEDLSQAANELVDDSFNKEADKEENKEVDILAVAEASMGIVHVEEPQEDMSDAEAVLDSFLDRLAANAEEVDAVLTKEAKDYDFLPDEPDADDGQEDMAEEAVEEETDEETYTEAVENVSIDDKVEVKEEPVFVYEPPKEEPRYFQPTLSTNIIEERIKIKDKDSNTEECSVVTSGMIVKGNISSIGSLDVFGKVEGDININGQLSVTGTVNGNTEAGVIVVEGAEINGDLISEDAVQIGRGSVVKGNIAGTRAIIAGAVKGDIDVHGPVLLESTAIVMGNIKSKAVQINNGAAIEGMCSQCYADVSPTAFFGE